jgi:DNA replication protein DnaC
MRELHIEAELPRERVGAVAEDPSVCPQCGGRGWVVLSDGGAGSAVACECRRQDLGARLLAASGIPSRYQRCRLEGFRSSTEDDAAVREQLQRARAVSERYVEEFLRPDGSFNDAGLIFVGPAGTGKTHLAAAVLTALIERYRVRGRFVEFTALIDRIQSTFSPDSPASKRTILDPVMRADLLVIDELGAQKPSAWVQDLLYLIINGRYTARLPTLFTTNYLLDEPPRSAAALDSGAPSPGARPESLSYRLSETLVSRLCEMARPVELTAVADYRRAILMQRRRA